MSESIIFLLANLLISTLILQVSNQPQKPSAFSKRSVFSSSQVLCHTGGCVIFEGTCKIDNVPLNSLTEKGTLGKRTPGVCANPSDPRQRAPSEQQNVLHQTAEALRFFAGLCSGCAEVCAFLAVGKKLDGRRRSRLPSDHFGGPTLSSCISFQKWCAFFPGPAHENKNAPTTCFC